MSNNELNKVGANSLKGDAVEAEDEGSGTLGFPLLSQVCVAQV